MILWTFKKLEQRIGLMGKGGSRESISKLKIIQERKKKKKDVGEDQNSNNG